MQFNVDFMNKIPLAGTVKWMNAELRASNIDDATLYLILKQAYRRESKSLIRMLAYELLLLITGALVKQ